MCWELNFSPLLSPQIPPARSPPTHAQRVPRQTPAPSQGDGRSPAQPWGGPDGSRFFAEGEGREAPQLAEKNAYERQTRRAAEKAPGQPVLPSRCLPRRSCSPRRMPAPLFAPQPLLAGSPPPAGQVPGPMALRKPALGTGAAQRWLGLDRLPPFSSPSLPPWLWVLSILNRLGFQCLFNSFLGSAFSLYVLSVWFCSLPFHFQPAKNAGSAGCALYKGQAAAGQGPSLDISGWTR